MSEQIHYKEIPDGFEYGAAKVSRLFSNPKNGWTITEISTPKTSIQVYVTKTGNLRVFGDGGIELKLTQKHSREVKR
ncbi:MAG TPA: hypothetical protein PKH07_14550 [bacterium]|nr:hypothetical protein [bacterium]